MRNRAARDTAFILTSRSIGTKNDKKYANRYV